MQLFFEPARWCSSAYSRQTGPGAYNNLEMLLSYGYAGRIYLVHPKVPEILGYKTYPRVADLPEVPDLAVISLGRERVVPAFQECAAARHQAGGGDQPGVCRRRRPGQGTAGANSWPWPGSTASGFWGPTPWGSSTPLAASPPPLSTFPGSRRRRP